MTLLYISIPFAVAGGVLLVLSQTTNAGVWRALDFAIYAAAVGILWALTVTGYLIWTVLRDGWQTASVPAAVILVIIATGTAVWLWRSHSESSDCTAAHAFYARLAGLPEMARHNTVLEGSPFILSPSPCAIEGLRTWFGRDPAPPEGDALPLGDRERLKALQEMLEAGLPPDDALLDGFAATDGDAAAARLILERRRQLNAEDGGNRSLFPKTVVSHALSRAAPCATDDPSEDALRYREVLRVLVEIGKPDPASLDPGTREGLACLGITSSPDK